MPDTTSTPTPRLWQELETQRALTLESRELLIRLETKLENLSLDMSELRTGTTMPRCAAHASRLDHLEPTQNSMHTKLWRVGSALAVGFIMLGIKTLWELITK
jgi:hypothetical protein